MVKWEECRTQKPGRPVPGTYLGLPAKELGSRRRRDVGEREDTGHNTELISAHQRARELQSA